MPTLTTPSTVTFSLQIDQILTLTNNFGVGSVVLSAQRGGDTVFDYTGDQLRNTPIFSSGSQGIVTITHLSGSLTYDISTSAFGLTIPEVSATRALVSGDGAVVNRSQAGVIANVNRGALICDWSASATGTPSTAEIYPEAIYPAPAVPQCNGAAGTYTCATNVASQSSDFGSVGVWLRASARADGQPYSYARIDLGTDGTFANRALCAVTIRADGRWRYCVLPRAQWGGSGSFTMGTTTFNNVRLIEQGGATALTFTGSLAIGATSAALNANWGGTTEIYPVRFSSNEVRYALLTNGSTAVTWGGALTATATTSAVASTTRLQAQTGDTIQAGPLRRDPAGRAFAMIRFDDGCLDQYQPRITLATPYVGQSGVTIPAGVPVSCLSLVQAFGLRANCFIVTRKVNSGGQFMSLAQLLDLQNTYGWNICFQTNGNPLSLNNVGLRLLGPYGFNLAATTYGSIFGVAGNIVTTTAAHQIVTTSSFAGNQGFQVQLLGPTPPASTLSVGQQVWLKDQTTTTFTIHLTEDDACNNVNPVTLNVGGTSWGYRWWGSAADGSAILADFRAGQSLMQGWGLNGWRHYALNQGGYDQVTEEAALTLAAQGNLRLAQGTFGASGTGSASWIPKAVFGASCAGLGFVGGGQFGTTMGNWLNGSAALATETVSEANTRAAVQQVVQRGGVVSNYHHSLFSETATRQLIAYLDELKLRQDQGLLQVVTAEELWLQFASVGNTA